MDIESVSKEDLARALLKLIFSETPSDIVHRWNVKVEDNRIAFCRNLHEKNEGCDWEPIAIGELSERYLHIKRGTTYTTLGIGGLQNATGVPLSDGDNLVAYVGDDNKLWFREINEFLDGRFEPFDTSREPPVDMTELVTNLINETLTEGLVDISKGTCIADWGHKTEGQFQDHAEEVLRNVEDIKALFSGTGTRLAVPIPDRNKMSPELSKALEKAVIWMASASPEEKQAMYAKQRQAILEGPFGPTDGMGTVYGDITQSRPSNPVMDKAVDRVIATPEVIQFAGIPNNELSVGVLGVTLSTEEAKFPHLITARRLDEIEKRILKIEENITTSSKEDNKPAEYRPCLACNSPGLEQVFSASEIREAFASVFCSNSIVLGGTCLNAVYFSWDDWNRQGQSEKVVS